MRNAGGGGLPSLPASWQWPRAKGRLAVDLLPLAAQTWHMLWAGRIANDTRGHNAQVGAPARSLPPPTGFKHTMPHLRIRRPPKQWWRIRRPLMANGEPARRGRCLPPSAHRWHGATLPPTSALPPQARALLARNPQPLAASGADMHGVPCALCRCAPCTVAHKNDPEQNRNPRLRKVCPPNYGATHTTLDIYGDSCRLAGRPVSGGRTVARPIGRAESQIVGLAVVPTTSHSVNGSVGRKIGRSAGPVNQAVGRSVRHPNVRRFGRPDGRSDGRRFCVAKPNLCVCVMACPAWS